MPIALDEQVVSERERIKSALEGRERLPVIVRAAKSLARHGLDDGECVLHAVRKLAEQQSLPGLPRLPVADVLDRDDQTIDTLFVRKPCRSADPACLSYGADRESAHRVRRCGGESISRKRLGLRAIVGATVPNSHGDVS